MEYCDRCARFFPNERALEQHEQSSGAHNICSLCRKDFATFYQLKQHWVASPRHNYCQDCNEHFDDQDELDEHYEEEHYYCAVCRKLFTNQIGLHEHNRQCHHYCPDCRRLFNNENNFRSHLRSGVHASANIRCPGQSCNRTFISGAALLLHMESGTCPAHFTRRLLDDYAHRYGPQDVIKDPRRMIGYEGGQTQPEVKTWATERAWNGRAFECFLCHRGFRSLDALNKHLGSPAHEEKKYRCPQSYSGCGKEFTTLSSLCQHVESEMCDIRRFNSQFQRQIENLTNGMKRIAF